MATITVSELATTLDTDARTTRKFLRNITPKDDQPGKGARWAIEKRDIRSLRSKFTKFTAEEAKAKEARAAIIADAATTDLDDSPAEDDTLDLDPTDADLEMIASDDLDA